MVGSVRLDDRLQPQPVHQLLRPHEQLRSRRWPLRRLDIAVVVAIIGWPRVALLYQVRRSTAVGWSHSSFRLSVRGMLTLSAALSTALSMATLTPLEYMDMRSFLAITITLASFCWVSRREWHLDCFSLEGPSTHEFFLRLRPLLLLRNVHLPISSDIWSTWYLAASSLSMVRMTFFACHFQWSA